MGSDYISLSRPTCWDEPSITEQMIEKSARRTTVLEKYLRGKPTSGIKAAIRSASRAVARRAGGVRAGTADRRSEPRGYSRLDAVVDFLPSPLDVRDLGIDPTIILSVPSGSRLESAG